MSIIRRLFNISRAEFSSRSSRSPSHPRHDDGRGGGHHDGDFTQSGDSLEAQYYANLELTFGASIEEIRKSYKKLMRKYHPDFYGNDEGKRKVAEEIVQRLNEAKNYFEEKQ